MKSIKFGWNNGCSNGWTKSTKFELISSNRKTKLDFVNPLDEILWPTFKSIDWSEDKFKFSLQ